MITEAEIRDRLYAYLAREMTLNEFEDWLVQRSWNMHQDSPESAQRLVAAVELRLSEYSGGHLPDSALDRELQGLVARPYFVRLPPVGNFIEPQIDATESTSEVLEVDLRFAQAA